MKLTSAARLCLGLVFWSAIHPARAASELRYLFIIETSLATAAQRQDIARAVTNRVNSGWDGQIRTEDSLSVWTFDRAVRTREFVPIAWDGRYRTTAASSLSGFLDSYFFSQEPADPVALGTALSRVVAASDSLTISVLACTATPITGTPFDAKIRAACQRLALTGTQTGLVETTLLARRGQVIGWTIQPVSSTLPLEVSGANKAAQVTASSVAQAGPMTKSPSKALGAPTPIASEREGVRHRGDLRLSLEFSDPPAASSSPASTVRIPPSGLSSRSVSTVGQAPGAAAAGALKQLLLPEEEAISTQVDDPPQTGSATVEQEPASVLTSPVQQQSERDAASQQGGAAVAGLPLNAPVPSHAKTNEAVTSTSVGSTHLGVVPPRSRTTFSSPKSSLPQAKDIEDRGSKIPPAPALEASSPHEEATTLHGSLLLVASFACLLAAVVGFWSHGRRRPAAVQTSLISRSLDSKELVETGISSGRIR